MPNGDDTPPPRRPPLIRPPGIRRPPRRARPGVIRRGRGAGGLVRRRGRGPDEPTTPVEGTPGAPPPDIPGLDTPLPFVPLPPDLVPGTPGAPPGTPPPDVPGRPVPRPVPGVPPFIGRAAIILGRATIATGLATILATILADQIRRRQDRRISRELAETDAAINERLRELREKQLINEEFVGPAPGTTPVGTGTGSGRRVRPYTTIVVRDVTRPGTSGIATTPPRPTPPPPVQLPEIDLPAPELPQVGRPEIARPTVAEPVQTPPAAPAPPRPAPPTPTIPGRIVDLVRGIITSPIIAPLPGTGAIIRSTSAPGLIARPGARPAVPGIGAPTGVNPLTPTIPSVTPTIPGVAAPPSVDIPTQVATATAAGIGVTRRVRTDDCQALARSRRRGRCREGFFKETRSGIRFTTWRVRDCAGGGVIAEK